MKEVGCGPEVIDTSENGGVGFDFDDGTVFGSTFGLSIAGVPLRERCMYIDQYLILSTFFCGIDILAVAGEK